MEFKDVITARQSTRSFTSRPVSSDEIKTMLSAAISAPSACNMQSWHFYIVTGAEAKNRLSESRAVSAWATDAPVIFIICTDSNELTKMCGERAVSLYTIQDTAAATENLLLSAADLGLGGCSMGTFDENACIKALDIAPEHKIVAVVPVGEPSVRMPEKSRKPLSEVVTFIGTSPVEVTRPDADPFRLSGELINGAVFTDIAMENALFEDIDMPDTTLKGIDMHGAKLKNVNISHSELKSVNMSKAYALSADVNGATLEDSVFTGADFVKCSFRNATFNECDFIGATADGVSIKEAVEKYKEQ